MHAVECLVNCLLIFCGNNKWWLNIEENMTFSLFAPYTWKHWQCCTILNKTNYMEHRKKKITNMVFVNQLTPFLRQYMKTLSS